MPTFIQNADGSYSEQTLAPFDPGAAQNQITTLKGQIADLQSQAQAAADLASRNAIASFQDQTETVQANLTSLQAILDAFNAWLAQQSQQQTKN
jgi:hypothetical protein